mmetsp:Transcript_15673/g.31616  ORF Transcript_15673/g.31616 Transcript_15673/m.31616 type:complete len:80 (-) Transcript_15673:11-250(-)
MCQFLADDYICDGNPPSPQSRLSQKRNISERISTLQRGLRIVPIESLEILYKQVMPGLETWDPGSFEFGDETVKQFMKI